MRQTILLLTACALFPSTTCDVARGALVGYWAFNEAAGTAASDSSPSNNSGTLLGTTLPQWVVGHSGQLHDYALSFSGGSGSNASHVLLGNPDALKIAGNQTISMWLSPDNFDTRQNPYAKEYGGSGTITQESDGTLTYYFGGAGANAPPYLGRGSASSINAATWNHVAVVRDLEAGQVQWYLDGNLATTASTGDFTPPDGSNPVVPGDLPAYIGRGYAGAYVGDIDDVAVWDEALSPRQIAWLSQERFAPNKLPVELPVIRYDYDDQSPYALPDAHSDYYKDEGKDPDEDGTWDNPTGDLTDGLFVGHDGATGPRPDDTSVGWLRGSEASITFELAYETGIDYVILGGVYSAGPSNDTPDDVYLSFSSDGTNFTAPLHFETPFGTDLHNEAFLELPETIRGSHIRLTFDGGTGHNLGKYLIDEVEFFQDVPEPTTLFLLLLGLAGLLFGRRSQRTNR